MNDTKGHDWAKDWQALQRQYWTAWSDLTRNQAGAEAPDPSTPWHEGLEMWSRMFGKASKQSEAAERLMASAKDYLALMQSMLEFASGKNTVALGPQPWLDAMRNSFNMPGLDAALVNNPVGKALREIAGQGVKSFEQLASGAVPMLEQMQKDGRAWLQAPAFGYAREHQEHYQKMVLAFADFQEAVGRYNALILKSSQRSFEILETKLAERGEPGRQVDSVRALYDLWVDAAEEGYAEIALSEEFRKIYGDVVNAQMRVRSQLQQEVERIGVDLGMPTRTELNSVHKRMHELRRELRASQEALREPRSDGRDGEIGAMRAEIEELRRLLENSAPAPAAPRAAAAAPAAAKPARRRKRSAPRSRRVAAKRAHVATKTTVVADLAPPAPAAAAPKPAAKPKAPAAKPAKAQRPARRPAPRRAASRPERRVADAAAPLSFGAAIAAMRRDLARGKRKSKGARLSNPAKTSSRLERKS